MVPSLSCSYRVFPAESFTLGMHTLEQALGMMKASIAGLSRLLLAQDMSLPYPAKLVHHLLASILPHGQDTLMIPYGRGRFATLLSTSKVCKVLAHLFCGCAKLKQSL